MTPAQSGGRGSAHHHLREAPPLTSRCLRALRRRRVSPRLRRRLERFEPVQRRPQFPSHPPQPPREDFGLGMQSQHLRQGKGFGQLALHLHPHGQNPADLHLDVPAVHDVLLRPPHHSGPPEDLVRLARGICGQFVPAVHRIASPTFGPGSPTVAGRRSRAWPLPAPNESAGRAAVLSPAQRLPEEPESTGRSTGTAGLSPNPPGRSNQRYMSNMTVCSGVSPYSSPNVIRRGVGSATSASCSSGSIGLLLPVRHQSAPGV